MSHPYVRRLVSLERGAAPRSKMRRLGVLAGLGLSVVLLLAGCGDSPDNTRDFDTAQFSIRAYSSFNDSPNLLQLDDPSGTMYTLTSARLSVARVKLRLPYDVSCGDIEDEISGRVECDDNDIKVEGPFIVELRSGQTTPDLSGLTIPALDYQSAALEVERLRATDQIVPISDELIDQTMVAHADFEYENSKRELLLKFRYGSTARARIDGAVVADDTLALRLDVAGWLRGIPVTTCLQRGYIKARDGVVTVDGNDFSGDCSEADDQFENNFDESLSVVVEPAPKTATEGGQ